MLAEDDEAEMREKSGREVGDDFQGRLGGVAQICTFLAQNADRPPKKADLASGRRTTPRHTLPEAVMTRSRLSLVALLLAAFAVTACSNPTGPQQPKQAKASLGVYGGSSTYAPEPPKP